MNSYKLPIIGITSLFVIVILFALSPFTAVPTGSVGVVTHFGSFNGELLQSGFHIISPIGVEVTEMDIRQQTYNVDASAAYTKDGQPINIKSSIIFSLDPSQAGAVYSSIGLNYKEKILPPYTEDTVKQEIAKYTAIEIPQNREKIRQAIETNLKKRLAESHIIVMQYNLVNEDYDDKYEEAIKQKQVEEQNAKKAEYITQQKEEQKKQDILQAQALAEKSRLEALALQNQANAESLIQKIRAEALLEAAKKWDGKLPNQMIPGSTLPFIQVGD